MQTLIYSLYRLGHAGLSNTIMSLELGVVLARLTDRLLILEGNISPKANVARYNDQVRNTYPSKVTDLIDLGVPWENAEDINLAAFAPHELCAQPAWECAFYYPACLAIDTDDFRSFAGTRQLFITAEEELQNVPALSFSCGADRNSLSFYSYFFYLDRTAQAEAFDALHRMRPKAEYAAFAERMARDLGSFNAVHIRRGDFKVTNGVTTLNRTPEHAIEALDEQFDRDDLLVILTDEADDPFFGPVKSAFKNNLFIDQHILSDYTQDFLDLPAHDSMALAYLSQLIAAEAQGFIGSMTSTFTALIQRLRGSGGKDEQFQFLWNEHPNPEDVLEPGRHAIGDAIRLKRGMMVPEREGRYSWNRYSQRLNPAWMREWPESFLNLEAMVDRTRGRYPAFDGTRPSALAVQSTKQLAETREAGGIVTISSKQQRASADFDAGDFVISFKGASIAASSNRPDVAKGLRHLFEMMVAPRTAQAGAEIRVELDGDKVEFLRDGKVIQANMPGSSFMRSFYRQVICYFIDRYPSYVWLHAGCAASAIGALILPGAWARGKTSLVIKLCEKGWTFLSDDIVPLDPEGCVWPFPGTPQIRSKPDRELPRAEIGGLPKSALPLDRNKLAVDRQPLAMIVFPQFVTGAAAELTPISAARALAQLIENCLSFVKNEDATISRLGAAVARIPAYELRFGDVVDAAMMLDHVYELKLRAVQLAAAE